MNNNIKLLLASAAVLTVLAIVIVAMVGSRPEEQKEVVFCAQDVRMCTDGTYVQRIPPTCEFAACPSGSALEEDAELNNIDEDIEQEEEADTSTRKSYRKKLGYSPSE